jgi:hypothetical protein
MKQIPSWEANLFAASQEIPHILWNRRFITTFTSTRHLSLSWASSIQSTPSHLTSCRYILILSSHLHLGLPICLFPSGFPTKNLYTPLPSVTRATCPVNISLLNSIVNCNKNVNYLQFDCNHNLRFNGRFRYTEITDLLLFTINVLKSHRHPHCSLQLVCEGRVLFVWVDPLKSNE